MAKQTVSPGGVEPPRRNITTTREVTPAWCLIVKSRERVCQINGGSGLAHFS